MPGDIRHVLMVEAGVRRRANVRTISTAVKAEEVEE